MEDYEQQDLFIDAVSEALDVWPFEVINRNEIHDPFEPDLTVMDQDEWVFTVVCQWCESAEDQIRFFPGTFDMRKWIQDDDERPLYFALGVGGTPENPDIMCFSRFFIYARDEWPVGRLDETRIRRLCPESIRKAVEKDFERMYSPSRPCCRYDGYLYSTPIVPARCVSWLKLIPDSRKLV
ncbi:MAG: hypothetical protein IJ904_02400 [Candidatus Methanomethylophilaceae archaeon]|nr:hypothetical protein [Candidatus Methanomethylophilaceae archaeon]